MGYHRNHAIIVTSWNPRHIAAAHAKAQEIFEWVSPVSPEMMNGFASFFVPPDGSKEWWPDSYKGDVRRLKFKSWLEAQDGSCMWAEVWFGEEPDDIGANREAEIIPPLPATEHIAANWPGFEDELREMLCDAASGKSIDSGQQSASTEPQDVVS